MNGSTEFVMSHRSAERALTSDRRSYSRFARRPQPPERPTVPSDWARRLLLIRGELRLTQNAWPSGSVRPAKRSCISGNLESESRPRYFGVGLKSQPQLSHGEAGDAGGNGTLSRRRRRSRSPREVSAKTSVRLLARMKIAAYNSHLGLLRPENCEDGHRTVYAGCRKADVG